MESPRSVELVGQANRAIGAERLLGHAGEIIREVHPWGRVLPRPDDPTRGGVRRRLASRHHHERERGEAGEHVQIVVRVPVYSSYRTGSSSDHAGKGRFLTALD